MKNLLKITLLAAFVSTLALPALAQFRPASNYRYDLLQGNPIKIATTGITNIPVPAYIGKDGFSVTPYFVGTNSGTANLAFLAIPMTDGTYTNTTAPTGLGNVAMNGTTPVRGSVFVAATTLTGCGLVTIQITNAHTATLTVSNLYIGAW